MKILVYLPSSGSLGYSIMCYFTYPSPSIYTSTIFFLRNVPTCIVFPVPQYIVAYFSSDIIGIIFSVSSPLLLTRVSHLSNSSYIELFLFSL